MHVYYIHNLLYIYIYINYIANNFPGTINCGVSKQLYSAQTDNATMSMIDNINISNHNKLMTVYMSAVTN